MLEDVAMADLTGSPVIDQAPDSIFVAKIESLASSLAQA
jgi:hypothetical protein